MRRSAADALGSVLSILNIFVYPENDIVFFPAGEFPQIFVQGIWEKSVRDVAWGGARVMRVSDAMNAASYIAISRKALR